VKLPLAGAPSLRQTTGVLDERLQFRWLIAPAGVVQEEAGESRRKRRQHPLQLLMDLGTLAYNVTYTHLNPETKIVLTTRPTPVQAKAFNLPREAGRQNLPLHRLPEHRPGRRARRRGHTRVRKQSLRMPMFELAYERPATL